MKTVHFDIRDTSGRQSGFSREPDGTVVVRGVLPHGTRFSVAEFLRFAREVCERLPCIGYTFGCECDDCMAQYDNAREQLLYCPVARKLNQPAYPYAECPCDDCRRASETVDAFNSEVSR